MHRSMRGAPATHLQVLYLVPAYVALEVHVLGQKTPKVIKRAHVSRRAESKRLAIPTHEWAPGTNKPAERRGGVPFQFCILNILCVCPRIEVVFYALVCQ